MGIELIKDEIEKILWSNKVFADGGASLFSLGVNEKDYPIVYQIRDLTICVCHIRRNQRVYLSIRDNGNSIGGKWAMFDDIPTKAIRELYKIVKPYKK